MEGTSTANVDCPVCQKSFKQSVITKHVNDCLNGVTEDTGSHDSPQLRRKRRESADFFSPKRRKTSTSRQLITSSQNGSTSKSKVKGSSKSSTSSPFKPVDQHMAKETVDIFYSDDDDEDAQPNDTSAQDDSDETDIVEIQSSDGDIMQQEEKTVKNNRNKKAKHSSKTSKAVNSEVKSSTPSKDLKFGLANFVSKKSNSKQQSSRGSKSDNVNAVPASSKSPGTAGPSPSKHYTGSRASAEDIKLALDSTGKPLADRMRPLNFDDYLGQESAVGKKSMLRTLLQSDQVPSLMLWGPPGCGKTTLAKIIAHNCKNSASLKFTQLSAAMAGVNDVKEVIKVAKNDQRMFKKKTILFLDEIHRFNKTQQDSLLPHVEDGTIILIGATTENPSFQVNSALLSRCRVIVLNKLDTDALEAILHRAIDTIGATVISSGKEVTNGLDGESSVYVESDAVTALCNLCDGDARAALTSLHMALQSCLCTDQSEASSHRKPSNQQNSHVIVTADEIYKSLQRSHVLYDRAGEEHYTCISAMHKSIRGSDDTAALYWLARMLEGGENPLYVARRLVRIASEDIGLADPEALNQAVSAYQACHFIGMPECDVILAQCAVYLSRAPKSVEVYKAYEAAKSSVRDQKGALPPVPLHLRNANSKLMKSLGYGKGYKYNPDFKEPVKQDYLPQKLKALNFFK